MSRLKFKLEREANGSRARAGSYFTLHGEVKTPIFMPVGTQATVKSQTIDSLKSSGSRVLLANTYHLLLRPGLEVFEKLGGIHRFMNWDGPVLTDSGGFQIFSLPHSRQMDEEGARFQSYVDGKPHLLSPEASLRMQKAIGSDIMMVLDQCIPSTSEKKEALSAMELTHRWAVRSLKARGDSPQSLFGIVQGACYTDLRKQSADFLCQLPFDGFAIGGLAVGESKQEREDFTEFTASLLPNDLPRYLMGVGTPLDILEAVHRGVDMFDCILPSALAQRGVAFTSIGKLQLRRGVYKFSETALDPACHCSTCKNYSRAYLHHLYKAEEVLGWTLIAYHNLTFYHQMMREIRDSIMNGHFLKYYHAKREALSQVDDENPIVSPKSKKTRVRNQTQLGDYEVHLSKHGFSSIRQLSSGEIMHSVNDPIEEANRLYIDQSRLKERLSDKNIQPEPFVIWDVGMGAATNAMAALQCSERLIQSHSPEAIRPVQIVSFERDLDPLRLALKHPTRFQHLRHGAPHELLNTGSWTHPSHKARWDLLLGDFMEEMEKATLPDLIFYDPFSSKTDADLWTLETFTKIFKKCSKKQCALFTYSNSTSVRATLLAAGFTVTHGVSTGPKTETTVAFTQFEDRDIHSPLLDQEWLKKWGRSQAQFPSGFSESDKAQWSDQILQHRQFNATSSNHDSNRVSPRKG